MAILVEKLPRYRDRAMAAFIVDDLSGQLPEDARAFGLFRRKVQEAGIKGECSVILGLRRTPEGKALPLDRGFVPDLLAAQDDLDANMEVMTHSCLYDFAADRARDGTQHEGVWLLDRSHDLGEYVEYFRGIARRAQAEGFRHAGITLPGCGCGPCAEFYSRGKVRWNATELNPMVGEALIQVMSEGLLAGRACNVFVGSDGLGPADAHVLAEKDGFGVYDVPPGIAGDHLGRWDKNPEHLNPDAYITADGAGGRLPQLLAQDTRTLVYYGHWQSLRPDTGIGFAGFLEVAARLARHHGDRIVWMRPSQIAAYRHTERHTEVRPSADGRSFTLAVPFAPLHPLTFRVSGVSGGKAVNIRTPGGQVLAPEEKTPAGLLLNLLPENGRYEFC